MSAHLIKSLEQICEQLLQTRVYSFSLSCTDVNYCQESVSIWQTTGWNLYHLLMDLVRSILMVPSKLGLHWNVSLRLALKGHTCSVGIQSYVLPFINSRALTGCSDLPRGCHTDKQSAAREGNNVRKGSSGRGGWAGSSSLSVCANHLQNWKSEKRRRRETVRNGWTVRCHIRFRDVSNDLLQDYKTVSSKSCQCVWSQNFTDLSGEITFFACIVRSKCSFRSGKLQPPQTAICVSITHPVLHLTCKENFVFPAYLWWIKKAKTDQILGELKL